MKAMQLTKIQKIGLISGQAQTQVDKVFQTEQSSIATRPLYNPLLSKMLKPYFWIVKTIDKYSIRNDK